MRLFLDTEFNGFGGELISLALVPEAGAVFYEVLEIPDDVDPWVAEHVVPYLGENPRGRDRFRDLLHEYLRGHAGATIVADWFADLEHLLASLAGPDYASSLDVPLNFTLAPAPRPLLSMLPHNALADAIALREAWLTHESRIRSAH